MILYTASIEHSRETLKRFTTVQYDTFEFGRKVILSLISLMLIGFGLFSMMKTNSIISIVSIAAGCLLITNINFKAQSVADSVDKALKGNYPKLSYTFTEEGFKDGDKRPVIPYTKLFRLIEDDDSLFLFTSKASGYMIKKESVAGNGCADGLKKLLAEKAALSWSRPYSIMTFSLADIFKLKKR